MNLNSHLGLSQAGQEEFVIMVLKNKTCGTFIEVGSEHPVLNNNTFFLERYSGWNGMMIEYNPVWEEWYKKWRTSDYIIGDAVDVDYVSICKALTYGRYLKDDTIIDYLQIDLDVANESTIKTLENFDKNVFDKYKFRVITFEHDKYTGWCGEDTRTRSREIFERRGYLRVFGDVKHNLSPQWCVAFEDWYVMPELVDMNLVNRIKRDESLNHDEIIKILHKCK